MRYINGLLTHLFLRLLGVKLTTSRGAVKSMKCLPVSSVRYRLLFLISVVRLSGLGRVGMSLFFLRSLISSKWAANYLRRDASCSPLPTTQKKAVRLVRRSITGSGGKVHELRLSTKGRVVISSS